MAVNANGHSGGILVTWNETLYTKKDEWTGQFVVVVKLQRKKDDFQWVVTLVYRPTNVTRRTSLWEELRAMVSTFQGQSLLFKGDFNVTLEVGDRPNKAGGRDPSSKEFWTFILQLAF